jgi:hypothetical protein
MEPAAWLCLRRPGTKSASATHWLCDLEKVTPSLTYLCEGEVGLGGLFSLLVPKHEGLSLNYSRECYVWDAEQKLTRRDGLK